MGQIVVPKRRYRTKPTIQRSGISQKRAEPEITYELKTNKQINQQTTDYSNIFLLTLKLINNLFIYLASYLFIHPLIYILIEINQQFIYLFIYPLIHILNQQFIYLFSYLFISPLIHILNQQFIYLFI
jgi:hypothetical protein